MANLHKSTTITHATLAASSSRISHGLGQLIQGGHIKTTAQRSKLPFNAKTALEPKAAAEPNTQS